MDNKLHKSGIKNLQGLSFSRLHIPRQPGVPSNFPLHGGF